jgi:hypothetical protein
MNTPNKNNMETESAQAPIFDPFPEPQTMPKGWDFSGLMTIESLPVVMVDTDSLENEWLSGLSLASA